MQPREVVEVGWTTDELGCLKFESKPLLERVVVGVKGAGLPHRPPAHRSCLLPSCPRTMVIKEDAPAVDRRLKLASVFSINQLC